METDGDTWHIDPERAPLDYQRDNDLKTKGWEVLRFGSREVNEATTEYCVSTIMRVMNNLGGPDERTGLPARFNPNDPLGPQQLGLFDS